MPTFNVADELSVLQKMLRDAPTTGRGASQAQAMRIAQAMSEILPDREDRIQALNKMLPPGYGHIPSTYGLSLSEAGLLITWLYNLGPQDSLHPGIQLAPYAQAVLQSLSRQPQLL
jgi:hypothetical protein